jgi:hypothetical protein
MLYLEASLSLLLPSLPSPLPSNTTLPSPSSSLALDVGRALVFTYEQHGYHTKARHLLSKTLLPSFPYHDGLRLLLACLCPPHFTSEGHAQGQYEHLVRELQRMREGGALQLGDDPVR